jgi:hypothetical protein
MPKNIGSWWVAVGSFAVAIVLCLLAGPSPRAFGHRPAAACTGAGACGVIPPVGYSHLASTGLPNKPRLGKVDFVENRTIIGTSGDTGMVTVTANMLFVTLANNDTRVLTGESTHRVKITVDVNGSVAKKHFRRELRQRLQPGQNVIGPQISPELTVATESCIELDGSVVADGTVTVAPFAVASALFDGVGVIVGFSCAAP